jgi:hypothetical protein
VPHVKLRLRTICGDYPARTSLLSVEGGGPACEPSHDKRGASVVKPSKQQRRAVTVIAIAVATLALAGCGSESRTMSAAPPRQLTATTPASASNTSSSASAESSPSRLLTAPAVVAAADAICVRRNAEVREAAPKGALSMSVIASLATTHAATERAALAELSDLKPSRPVASKWRALLAQRRALTSELDDIARYARGGNATGMQSVVAHRESAKRRLLATAREFGYCADVD